MTDEKDKTIEALKKQLDAWKTHNDVALWAKKHESALTQISRLEGENAELKKKLKVAIEGLTPETREKLLEMYHILSEIINLINPHRI